jgi:carboxymethylenebutenolidase
MGSGQDLRYVADTRPVNESDVAVRTTDGLADGYFVHPAIGAHPGVLLWSDALGLRPAFRTIGKRLAEVGYSVLVMNPPYRTTPPKPCPPLRGARGRGR